MVHAHIGIVMGVAASGAVGRQQYDAAVTAEKQADSTLAAIARPVWPGLAGRVCSAGFGAHSVDGAA